MWQYITRQGVTALPALYLDALHFSEGLAWVQLRDGYTFINQAGEVRCSARFIQASAFNEGLAPMKSGHWYGYLDRQAQWAVDPIYNLIEPFSEGLGHANRGPRHLYFDSAGSVVLEVEAEMANQFSCGRALILCKDDVYYIDRTGRPVLGPFDFGEDFSENLARDRNGDAPRFRGRTGRGDGGRRD